MRQLNEKQRALLAETRIASVATIDRMGFPHLTAVWFYFDDGLLYLAVPSQSAKARNLVRNPRIAVMIDTRRSHAESGLTAVGECELVAGEAAVPIVRRLHEKYLTTEALADSRVGPVFAAMDDIAVRLQPNKWISWDMAELDRQAFAGRMAERGYLREIVP